MTRPVPLNVIAAYLSQRASVGAVAVAPSNTVAPVVSGTATEGQTLSCTTGTWTGDTPIVYTYQWQHGTTNISGATSSTYVISASYVGETIRCRVTATNAAGAATANSNATSPVSAVAPVNTVAPVVSGTAQQGQTLSTTDGTWTGTSPTFTYQWQRAGVNIGSATSNTYVLVSADYGSAIRCVVTATNAAGSASANSNATSAVTRTYAQEVLADTPNLYWKMNEASGPTVTDYSSNAKDFTAANSPTFGVTGPVTGDTAIRFASASSQYLQSTATNALSQSGDTFTIEFWFKKTSNPGAYQSLYSKGTDSGNLGLKFQPDETIILNKRLGGDVVATSAAITNTAAWHHFACVKNGGTSCKLYLDGVDVSGTVTNQTFTSDTGWIRAASRDGSGEFFDGSLAHMAFYPNALSLARLQAHIAAA